MECTCTAAEHSAPTPVEAYWTAVFDVVEWAGRQLVIEQPPLCAPDPEFQHPVAA